MAFVRALVIATQAATTRNRLYASLTLADAVYEMYPTHLLLWCHQCTLPTSQSRKPLLSKKSK